MTKSEILYLNSDRRGEGGGGKPEQLHQPGLQAGPGRAVHYIYCKYYYYNK